MNRVGTLAIVLAALSALFPTLLLMLFLIPWFVPIRIEPPPGLVYGLLAGWLLCALVRGVLSPKFTPLEQNVVQFWAFTLLFIQVFAGMLGAFPLLVLPALSDSLGWSFLRGSLYLCSTFLLILLCSVLIVWSLWRKHWAYLTTPPTRT